MSYQLLKNYLWFSDSLCDGMWWCR